MEDGEVVAVRPSRWRPTLDHGDEAVRKKAGYPARYTKAEINARRARYMKSDAKIAEESDKSLAEFKKRMEKEMAKHQKRDDSKSLLPSVSTVRVLRHTVFNDIQKTRSYQKIPCYLVFLILMTVSTIEHLLHDQDTAYFTVDAITIRMQADVFTQVDSWQSWWSWLESASDNLDALIPDNVHSAQVIGPGLPLGFLHIRQWRIADLTCDIPPGLSQSVQNLVNDTRCYRSWTSGSTDTRPFGSRPFRPDAHYEYPLLGDNVKGIITTYPRDKAYSTLLPLNNEETNLRAAVDSLMADGFIDEATSAVTVELTGYMPSRQQFFSSFFLMEAKRAGGLVETNHHKLFRGLSWDGDRDRFIFLTDLFAVCYIIWFIIIFLKDLRFHMRSAKNVMQVFNFWRAFDVVFITMWVFTIYYRFSLWNQGSSVSSSFIADRAKNYGGGTEGEAKVMVYSLYELVSIYEYTMLFQAWALLLAWLRLFAFIQHTERLGIVAHTIAAMAGTFLAILVMFLILVVGLSIAGVLVYSSDFKALSTFWKAFGLLLRFIFTQELPCKEGGECLQASDLERTDSTFTAIYIPLASVLGFVVFINVMVALVISNLTLVLTTSRSGGVYEWSPAVLWQELITASRRMSPQWLTKIFIPFTSRLFRHNTGHAKGVNTAGAAKPSDLSVGQPVMILVNEPGAKWEEGMVFEVVKLAGALMIMIKAGDKKIPFDSCKEVHHPLPTIDDKWLDVNMEERYLELIAILDSQPSKQYMMDKNEWLTMSKDFMPPRNALKLFELAQDNDKEATETEMGERFCTILTHRMNALQKVLDERIPKLAIIPRLKEREIKHFTNVLGPVTNTLLPHFTEAQHDIRQLRQGLATDFDALTTSFSQHFNNVAERQSRLGPQLDYINRHLHLD
eukprot:TRINITY_DN26254_c0_g1_i1.p1 TRINITY_DN26254_c0_g1~~TRINITY_DN26254_c0_g1_i1.p1  ORF type:complete len:910 (+),score=296.70 TRINITY_DN26254_c0_g1_i1:28-2730(+)